MPRGAARVEGALHQLPRPGRACAFTAEEGPVLAMASGLLGAQQWWPGSPRQRHPGPQGHRECTGWLRKSQWTPAGLASGQQRDQAFPLCVVSCILPPRFSPQLLLCLGAPEGPVRHRPAMNSCPPALWLCEAVPPEPLPRCAHFAPSTFRGPEAATSPAPNLTFFCTAGGPVEM